MKKSLIFLTVLLLSVSINAQSPKYSVGIIGSHFHNNSSSDRISEANNPFGYGLVLAGRFTEELSMGLTLEYLEDNLEFNNGEEKDLEQTIHSFYIQLKHNMYNPIFSRCGLYTQKVDLWQQSRW